MTNNGVFCCFVTIFMICFGISMCVACFGGHHLGYGIIMANGITFTGELWVRTTTTACDISKTETIVLPNSIITKVELSKGK